MNYNDTNFLLANVNRPFAGNQAETVTLRCEVAKDTEKDTKSFEVTILPFTVNDSLQEDQSFVSFENIKDLNMSQENITEDLLLYTKGPYGSTVEWKSNNTSIIDISTGEEGTENVKVGSRTVALTTKKAIVNRPSFTDGDVNVTLTAKFKIAETEVTKEFILTIIKLPISPGEKLTRYIDAINQKDLLGINDAASGASSYYRNVTEDLRLPPTDLAQEITNSWSSDDNTAINEQGQVTRPAASETNKLVKITLTSRIADPSSETKFKEKTRVFDFTVLKLEE